MVLCPLNGSCLSVEVGCGTGRMWFYVAGRGVYLEQVDTSHPNLTK